MLIEKEGRSRVNTRKKRVGVLIEKEGHSRVNMRKKRVNEAIRERRLINHVIDYQFHVA